MNSTDIKPEQLRSIKCLKHIADADCGALLEFLELEICPQNQVLFEEGAAGDCMYMILSGQVRVFSRRKGHEKTLKDLGPGDVFGDIAMFNHTPRLASVQATTEAKLLKLTEAALEKFAAKYPNREVAFLRALSLSLTQIYADFH